MENIEDLKSEILKQINGAEDLKSLDDIRVSVMGKKGKLTELMKGLGKGVKSFKDGMKEIEADDKDDDKLSSEK